MVQLNPDSVRPAANRLKRAQGQLAAVSRALDLAGFAIVATGLKQCISEEGVESLDVQKMEKLFLSLA